MTKNHREADGPAAVASSAIPSSRNPNPAGFGVDAAESACFPTELWLEEALGRQARVSDLGRRASREAGRASVGGLLEVA